MQEIEEVAAAPMEEEAGETPTIALNGGKKITKAQAIEAILHHDGSTELNERSCGDFTANFTAFYADDRINLAKAVLQKLNDKQLQNPEVINLLGKIVKKLNDKHTDGNPVKFSDSDANAIVNILALFSSGSIDENNITKILEVGTFKMNPWILEGLNVTQLIHLSKSDYSIKELFDNILSQDKKCDDGVSGKIQAFDLTKFALDKDSEDQEKR